MKTAGLAGLLFVSVLTAIAACGGDKPQPTTANNPPTDSSSTPTPVDSGSKDPTPVPASTDPPPIASSSSGGPTTASSDAGSGPAPKPPVIIGETKDECTPVGVDFEKRARPKLKECYAEGKKKNPNLEGTVKIKMTIDVKGKIKAVKVTEKTLPDPVANCMLDIVKKTPFPEVEKCWDATITIPITFPTPH